jgi:hypothetical protein
MVDMSKVNLGGAAMSSEQLRTISLIVSLTLVSGMGDAIGFIHAARVWQGGVPIWAEFAKSIAGFALGVVAYWFAIRYLNTLGHFAPEMQTLAWFVVTIVGMAVVSRAYFAWHISDQLVALSMVCCLGWLLVRTGS